MRLNKFDSVLHVLQLFMHSMAQEKPVLKITKRVLQQVFCWGFLFLIRDFLPLLDFFHYLHCFVFIYSGIFSSVYIFFTTKLCKIDYQANNFNTSNRRIALWIGMEALCALIQGHSV